MSKDWEIIKKDRVNTDVADITMCFLTGGLYGLLGGCDSDYTYTIRDSNGIEKKVTAKDENELGEKISKGKFD